MNYALRCMPPSCIAQQATAFDGLVIEAAQLKLLLHEDEASRHPTLERLRAPLRHGGFGLTSARKTSPAAFLGSMAAVAAAPVFAPYSEPDCPLPATSLVHGWIEDSMRTILDDVRASQDEMTKCESLLPPSAATFFQHFAPRSPSFKNSPAYVLQHELSSQATATTYKASLQRAMKDRKSVV